MSEEVTNNETAFAEAQEALETAKTDLAEAKGDFRKFKKENGVRKASGIKDEAIKKEFLEMEKAVEDATDDRDAAAEAVKELKPKKSPGGGESYAYGTIPDPVSKEERPLEKGEKKKWRAHARKVAAKTEGAVASQVPFDPDFFKPKVKAEKKAKVEKEAPAEEAKAEVPAEEVPAEVPAEDKKSRRARRAK